MGAMAGRDRLVWELLRGLMALAVLALVAEEGPIHGYGIRMLLAKRMGRVPPESTVYDVLKRLEKRGLLESFWARSHVGLRKYYRATREGVAVLENVVEEAREILGWLLWKQPPRLST